MFILTTLLLLVTITFFLKNLKKFQESFTNYYSKLTFNKIMIKKVEIRDKNTHNLRGWGYSDSHFELSDQGHLIMTGNRYEISGKNMPLFLPFFQNELDYKLDVNKLSSFEYPFPKINKRISNKEIDEWLTKRYKNKMKQDDISRMHHSHGHTHEDMYQLRNGFDRVIDTIIYPENKQDILDLINFAKSNNNVCIIPYGGGTNVTNSLSCDKYEKRTIISLDMCRMNQIKWVNTKNNTAEVQAGIIGKDLDENLRKHGYQSGHEPDSNEFSTLGGWIATSASGMKQAKYGNIEDIVLSVNFITPTGELKKEDIFPRTSSNFDLKHLIIGSEGNLGIITSAVIRIHRIPECQKYDSILFYNFKDGVQFLRHVAENNIKPASIRLVDNNQFRFGQAIKPEKKSLEKWIAMIQKFYVLNIKQFEVDKMVACTIVFEGTNEEVYYQKSMLHKIAKIYKGMFAGSESGRFGYHLTYAIAYIRDIGIRLNVMGESFETTVPWDKVHQVCEGVKKTVNKQHVIHKIPGKPYISWRVSQIYGQGVCVYFYYAFVTEGLSKPHKLYSKIEEKCRESIMKKGGSISHHHGIGKIRQKFVDKVFNKRSIKLLKTIKKDLDPNNIMACGNSWAK